MAARSSKDGNNAVTTEMKSVPDELIVEILSWLPIKHLSPFRFVCKPWLQLITREPQFAKLQFDRSIQLKTTNPNVLVKRNGAQRYYFSADHTTCDNAMPLELPFQQDSTCYSDSGICNGICNGLLCICSEYEDEVYIWNPITNDHITIPYPPTPARFPGCDKGTRVAFGFHPGTGEYKLIKIFAEIDYIASQFHSQLSVYTLGVDSTWRTVVDDIHYSMGFGSTGSPLVNGTLHFLSSRTGSFSLSAIVAFDLKDESLQEIPPPKDVNFGHPSTYNCIGELGGQLCMFSGHDSQGVQIWVMKQYGVPNSWTKLFTIGRPQVEGFFTFMEPLCVVAHSGDIILKKNMTDLILYHPNTKLISYPPNFGFEIYDACAYIGSIISPRVISGVKHTVT